MSATALAALLFSVPAMPALPAAQDPPALNDLAEESLAATDSSVTVTLVSGEGESEMLDVVSHGAPVVEVLGRIASTVGRKLAIDPGEAALRADSGVDVHLKRRPLQEVASWVAGSAGLVADVTRRDIHCSADVPGERAPEEQLARAIDAYRAALLRAPTHADAPRLRFEIANALYQLGDFGSAAASYQDLEDPASLGFGDLAFAYLRCGHARAQLGDEEGAQAQWLKIAELFPRHPLVAPARLAAVRSFRRQKNDVNANTVLRLVVESMRDGLAPEDLIEAGELLHEGGNSERAIEALQWALQSNADPALEQRGLVALARAQLGRKDWPGVVATADRYVKRHPEGRRGAEIEWLLAIAHRELGDPFTALLALARARELDPDDRVEMECDLLEGTLYAECGIAERATVCLARAAVCEFPEIAAPALATYSRVLIDEGQFEAARLLYDRLATLEGHEIEAAIGRAQVSLLQHNRRLCLAVVNETLPRADPAQRALLLEIASEALKDATEAELAQPFTLPQDEAAPESHPDANSDGDPDAHGEANDGS